jgi:TolA-binding protein
MAFEELGELEDAKTFYDAVISQYPNSKEAERATNRKKSLGKKKKKSA